MFRNSFTYKGRRFQVSHWSVKIQHLGTRKTFSLRAADGAGAAGEACRLYKAIVTRGWESVGTRAKGEGPEARPEPGAPATPRENGFEASYWRPRLIHRKYTETLHSSAERELSARVEHAGASHYFPLGTDNRKLAASRAVRIYQTVAGQGWDIASQRFPREVSVAFRWADNPVAWTYTTVHTQPAISQTPPIALGSPVARLNVAIAESDAGLRRALAWCINREEGCCCVATFATAAIALREVRRQATHVVLVSQSLADKAGTVCLEELKIAAPKVAGVLFSVYEDTDQLFKSAPGGAPGYLFRRTAPTRILAPIAAAWERGAFTREDISKSVRSYFEETVASLPVGGTAHHLTKLTQREHEILALLSKGHPDKEIAELLRISTWTVHGHLKKIFEKLSAHNRTDAVVKYLHK